MFVKIQNRRENSTFYDFSCVCLNFSVPLQRISDLCSILVSFRLAMPVVVFLANHWLKYVASQ